MVTVNVSAAGKPIALARGLPMVVELPGKQLEDATIADVKSAIAKKYPKVSRTLSKLVLTLMDIPKFYQDRQKIALKDSRNLLADNVTLKDAGVVEGGELSVKDLGAQVSWKTVFLVEYVSVMCISWLSATNTSSVGWPTVHSPSNLLPPRDILRRCCAAQYASTVCTCMTSVIVIVCSGVISYVLAFVILHFAKRELETLFVHRFSHATMPISNIF